MSDDLAEDQIAAFVDRILRLKAEADDIAADIKEIYAEAHANGLNKTRLGEIVTYLRKVEKDKDGVAEAEAIRDLYLEAYYRAKNKPHTHAYARGAEKASEGIAKFTSERGSFSPKTAPEEITPEHDADGVIIETRNPAPDSAQMPDDHSDLSVSPVEVVVQNSLAGAESVEGQQPIQPETANEMEQPALSASDPQWSDAAPRKDAGLVAPTYAKPGAVVSEHAPPEPVKRHPISAAFAELGQDTKALRLAIYTRGGGVAEPIVKIGAQILDGWQRYDTARSLFIDYPVVQYEGTDLLADAVRWNLVSRKLTQGQISTVISRLVKLYPDREQEILGMFDDEYAEAAQ